MFRRLQKQFFKERQSLLRARSQNGSASAFPFTFRKDTAGVRTGDWTTAPTPKPLSKRWVELTGPGNDPKMVIHAMNSKADGYMLDLEDSMAPTPDNVLQAHENIRRVVNRDLVVETATKTYQLNAKTTPTFMVRVRGLHMPHEDDGSAMLYDMCEFLEHSGKQLYESDRGPFLYIPKLETYEEAQLVNRMLEECERQIGLPQGSVKVTVLIETFPAIFQTEEIIFALKDRIVGLNCGRWDYLFSMMKCLPGQTFPDRETLNMLQPHMESYVRQIVRTCHKRGIHAMGGMSAFIPSKDEGENDSIMARIRDDKMLEIVRGCDGAWVAHPALIEPVQSLFMDAFGYADHQKHSMCEEVTSASLYPHEDKGPHTQVDNNIDVAIQYVTAWLSGNGAVAIDGLMEDLATAEISASQLRNWCQHDIITSDRVTDALCGADPRVRHILSSYIFGDAEFLHDVAHPALGLSNGFEPISFEGPFARRPPSGIELTKERGAYLKEYLAENPSYGFLGTTNGVSAVNVVAGGGGRVGPYAGGWQANAMKNRLGMLLPDTLHVSPEECANTAAEFNEHLHRARLVHDVEGRSDVDYSGMALLADLEQGWNTPEKTRIAVRRCVESGINVMHIEDQGAAKRCGHLGDKELNTYDDYAIIMRSANLAAREMGVHEDVTFVSRTDAYSAKRIHYSVNLADDSHPEHKYVDWARGASPDGKYLYLKSGINPATGLSYGLELSIDRGYRVVSEGLASHVWMETPDADLHIAKAFLDGVNDRLAPEGKRAYGLYNHSPSFDWDVKFVAEAKVLANAIAQDVSQRVLEYANSMLDDSLVQNRMLTDRYRNSLRQIIQESLLACGDKVRGDDCFREETIDAMIPHLLDYIKGEDQWAAQFPSFALTPVTAYEKKLDALTQSERERGFNPLGDVVDLIVEERLCSFGPMLASFGYNMHLITLPEFHVTSLHMHDLAKKFQTSGIEAFVSSTQRPERIRSDNDPTYTYYKHQTATGTGVEAAFSKMVGSSNVHALTASTESDDVQKRDQ